MISIAPQTLRGTPFPCTSSRSCPNIICEWKNSCMQLHIRCHCIPACASAFWNAVININILTCCQLSAHQRAFMTLVWSAIKVLKHGMSMPKFYTNPRLEAGSWLNTQCRHAGAMRDRSHMLCQMIQQPAVAAVRPPDMDGL